MYAFSRVRLTNIRLHRSIAFQIVCFVPMGYIKLPMVVCCYTMARFPDRSHRMELQHERTSHPWVVDIAYLSKSQRKGLLF